MLRGQHRGRAGGAAQRPRSGGGTAAAEPEAAGHPGAGWKKGSIPPSPPAPNPLGSAETEEAAPRWLRGAGSR